MRTGPCSNCTDDARCDRAGLCQDFARQQLPKPFPSPTTVKRCHLCELQCAEGELGGQQCTRTCVLLEHYQ